MCLSALSEAEQSQEIQGFGVSESRAVDPARAVIPIAVGCWRGTSHSQTEINFSSCQAGRAGGAPGRKGCVAASRHGPMWERCENGRWVWQRTCSRFKNNNISHCSFPRPWNSPSCAVGGNLGFVLDKSFSPLHPFPWGLFSNLPRPPLPLPDRPAAG